MIRSFISIDLPLDAKTEIKRIQDILKKENMLIGKFTEKENLHLTLKFLGEINEDKINEVKKRLSEIKLNNFEANMSELGVFSKDFVKIIWIKLDGKGIFDLQSEIDNKLKNIFPVEKRFMSHITIARVKKVIDKKKLIDKLNGTKVKDIELLVRDFNLMKSALSEKGPEYSVIERYELM
jgi:RNA 2',3'-cyclic 3'-phosphodiesterase